jgi:carbohydrate-selective porin OprB
MFCSNLPTGSRRLPLSLVAAFSLFHAGIAGAQQTSDNTSHKNFLSDWWGQSYGASYKWFGLEAPMKTYGFSVKGDIKEAYFGQVSGGLPNQPLSNWCFDMKLKGTLDLEKLFPVFSGWSISSYWRYRTGGNPRWAAGTPNFIAPSNMPNGAELWNLSQMLEYSSKKKELYFNIGWENPYEQFLQQPLSKIFENQAITTSKGIGANAGPGIVVTNPSRTSSYAYRTSPVPWGNTFGAWGTTLRVKPRRDTYIQTGLYWANSNMGGPNPTQFGATSVYPYTSVPNSYLGKFRSSGQVVPVVNGNGKQTSRTQNLGWVPGIANNHGFGGMGGSMPFNPQTQNIGVTGANVGNGGQYSQNGLFNVNEIGWEPKFGKDRIEGKYVIGSYVWGNNNSQFTPVAFTTDAYGARRPVPTQVSPVIWGLYFQADQQLFAEKGKNYQEDQVSMHGKVSKQGLYTFNEFTYTPPNGCQVPYYFQTGLVYKGLIPTRDNDMIGVCLGCAIYSDQYNQWIDSQNQALQNNYGSTYNATVPNGPTQYYPINANTGAPGRTLQNAYAYQPHFSSTQIIEACYDIQLTKWANFKPFVEYIINPAGNGTVPNVVILGASSKWFF